MRQYVDTVDESHGNMTIVRCSACGGSMSAEVLWREGVLSPSLLYRCIAGHITPALPIPTSLAR